MTVTRPQRILVLAPMYHVNAFATLHSMLSGDRLYVFEKFDAARIVDVIETPSDHAPSPRLRRCSNGSPMCPVSTIATCRASSGSCRARHRCRRRWCIGGPTLVGPEKIIMAYGGTEGLGITVLTGIEWMAHEGSVGRGYRGAELRILDDDGVDLPPGEIGHIYLRSPNQPRATYLGDVPQIPMTRRRFRRPTATWVGSTPTASCTSPIAESI